jgi:NTE family protein
MTLLKRWRRRPRVGLALGGGGARGLAHIGVLKTLEAHGIPIEVIAGTSIGALIGAAYALEPDVKKLQAAAEAFPQSPAYHESGLERFRKKKPVENFFGQVATYMKDRLVINLAYSRLSLVGGWRAARAVDFILPDKTFSDLRLPFVCVATDLRTGKEVTFQQGSLRGAVQASTSIPGFLPPVMARDYLLTDGAVVAPVPVQACRELGAEVVIAVDVGQSVHNGVETENVIDIIFRANAITSRKLTHLLLASADLVIRPKVGLVHWSEFRLVHTLVAEGERAAEEKVETLQELIKPKYFWRAQRHAK